MVILPSTNKKKPFGLVLNKSIAFSVISANEGCNAGFLSKLNKRRLREIIFNLFVLILCFKPASKLKSEAANNTRI